jgi:hypothetical protein
VGSSVRVIPTEVVDLTDSDDGEEETELEDNQSEASEATERNSDLPPPPYEQEQSSPCRRQDRFTSLRSPSPPGYVPPTFFQNIYAPPIRLRNEEEYRRHRRELITQYNRDVMDLFYKYEFHAQELKRGRRHYVNNENIQSFKHMQLNVLYLYSTNPYPYCDYKR